MRVARLWPLVLVAALGIVPIGPQEHVHEATDDHGHQTLIAHRHVQLHGLEAERPDQHGTLDHPDPITIVPNGIYTVPGSYVLHTPILVRTSFPAPSVTAAVSHRPRASDRLIHAPPRAPSSLRAPPASRLL